MKKIYLAVILTFMFILSISVNAEEGYEVLVKITIQDYQYCTPTSIYVYIVEDTEILYEIVKFNNETGNTAIGKIDFADFLTKEVVFE